jgi:hypothetical protein
MTSISQPFNEPTIAVTDAKQPMVPPEADAARTAFTPPADRLSEDDYRSPDQYGHGTQDVDRYNDHTGGPADVYGQHGV